jgi:VIT1/CCC1 family predicted Fe2+/Mn2+ transporter
MRDSKQALVMSAVITLLALAAFGFAKGHFTGVPKTRSALQTAPVGSIAAGAAYAIATFIA